MSKLYLSYFTFGKEWKIETEAIFQILCPPVIKEAHMK